MNSEKSSDQIKMDYSSWTKEQKLSAELNEPKIISVLSEIGITIDALFKENDSFKIRLMISELILKRSAISDISLLDYSSVINQLLNYAEFLDSHTSNEETGPSHRDKQTDTLTIAYYLSRLDRKAVKELGFKYINQTFKELGTILGQNWKTIKLIRDEFDPYFDNGRIGWTDRALSRSRQKILDRFKNTSDEELSQIVKGIISAYKPDFTFPETGHKKLKVSTGKMKEIRGKNK